MQATQSKYINTIDFLGLFSWDVKAYLSQSSTFNPSFPLVFFGEFLSKPNIEKIKINDEDEYKILGVRSYGKGVFANRTVKGKTLKMREYQKAKNNHLFWCKVDTKNGAFGVIKDDLADGVASSNMTFAEIDTNKINVNFLQLLFTSKGVMQYLDSFVTGTTNRKYIRPDQLLNEIKILLPKLSEQEKIVANYFKKTKIAETLLKESNNLESEIEHYIFEQLGIVEKTTKVFSKKIRIINLSNIERWGVEFNLGSNSSQLLESSKYKNQSLRDLVQINPQTTLPKQSLPISFLPMECISDEYGEVLELREKQSIDAKGYTKFQEGDLVWARITPCMQNGKSAIVKNLKNNLGCGSTEYHVIRNTNPEIELEYIYHLLRLKTVLSKAMSHFTGSAGQQRVPKYFLEELLIPVPEYRIQKLIAEKVNSLKLQKKQLKEKAENLKNEAKQEFEKEIFSYS